MFAQELKKHLDTLTKSNWKGKFRGFCQFIIFGHLSSFSLFESKYNRLTRQLWYFLSGMPIISETYVQCRPVCIIGDPRLIAGSKIHKKI